MSNPEVHDLKLLRVHDGDTIVCDINVGFNLWLHDERIRLARINCPELPTPQGQAAQVALAALLEQPGVTLEVLTTGTKPKDNYGRYEGEVFAMTDPKKPGINLSDWLLAHGYAQPWPAQPVPQPAKEIP